MAILLNDLLCYFYFRMSNFVVRTENVCVSTTKFTFSLKRHLCIHCNLFQLLLLKSMHALVYVISVSYRLLILLFF